MTGGWVRLDRRTVHVGALFMLGVAVIAGGPSVTGIANGTGSWPIAWAWVLPGAVVLVLLGVVAEVLRVRATRYRVGPATFELHSGVLVRRRRTLHRDRIRTVDVSANPLQRVFGLVTVRIGTGEAASKEGTVALRSVTPEVADELRATLLDRVVADRPTGQGRLAELDRSWIRYAPLSFLPAALGAAAFGGVMNVADWFGVQEGLVGAAIELFRDVPVPVVIAILFAAGMVVGFVAALGLWVELWWDFRLDREPGGTLRVRRGLTTTRSISLEEARLRGVELVEPLGIRLAGAARLDAVATGLRTAEEENKSHTGTLLPGAPREVADRLAADVLREPESPTSAPLAPHPVAARGRRVRWALATLVVLEFPLVLLGALLTDVLLHIAIAVAVVGVPVAVLLALDAYRSLGHATPEGYLVMRSGSVRRSTVALQRRGIIGWTVRQSIFQRRADLATVYATTAAGSGAYAIRDTGTGTGLDVADAAVPGLLAPFLERPVAAPEPAMAR